MESILQYVFATVILICALTTTKYQGFSIIVNLCQLTGQNEKERINIPIIAMTSCLKHASFYYFAKWNAENGTVICGVIWNCFETQNVTCGSVVWDPCAGGSGSCICSHVWVWKAQRYQVQLSLSLCGGTGTHTLMFHWTSIYCELCLAMGHLVCSLQMPKPRNQCRQATC